MIIIGEKLNSSIPKTMEAMNARDEDAITGLIRIQAENGADYLDVNTAICGADELPVMLWVLGLIQKNSSCGIMIDSPNPDVIKEAVKVVKDRKLILNSVTLTDRFEEVIPIAKEYQSGVVGLPIDSAGIPETAVERSRLALELISKMKENGIAYENIYLDVLTQAMFSSDQSALVSFDTIREIKKHYPKVHTICGLSNVSFGLPKRSVINCTYLSLAMAAGLDSAIMDPSAPSIKTCLAATNAILGCDEYCMEYVECMR